MNNRLFTPRRILLAVALIILILLLRECFKNRGGGGQAPDQLSIRYDAAVTNLNPFLTVQGSDIYTCARIFQSLGDLDAKTLEMAPVMVTQIPQMRTITEGPHTGELAFDFELLPEAKWDNGTPITGHDIAFSLKLIFHPLLASKAFLSYFKDLSGLEIDPANPKKFTVYFKKYYFMAVASMCQIPIMPSYNYDPSNRLAKAQLLDFLDTIKIKTLASDPDMIAFSEEFKQPKFAGDPNFVIGSGPYKLETTNEQGAILVKKENWWGDPLADTHPFLVARSKRLIYKVVKDENVVENMMKNGELDIIANSISAAKFVEMKQKDSLNSKFNFDLLPPQQYNRWLFNLAKPNLQDVRVRKALAHIVDYDHFIKNIRMNLAERTVGPILPIKPYYAKDIVPYDFNIQKAKDLLAEAGWKDSNGDGIVDKTINGVNTKLVIEVMVPPIRTNQQYAESVVETARLAGIEIKPVNTDITEIGPRTRSGDYESAFLAAALFPGYTELAQRYHSKSLAPAGDNRSHYINPQLDNVIERIAAEPDEAKRGELYKEAQRILHEDLPEIFLFAPNQPVITAKKFNIVTTGNRPGYYEQMFKLK